jgi:hypothetical protein
MEEEVIAKMAKEVIEDEPKWLQALEIARPKLETP